MAYIDVTEINSTTCKLQVLGLDDTYPYYRDYDWRVVNELSNQTVATTLQQTGPKVSSSPIWRVSGLTAGVLHSVECSIIRTDTQTSLTTLNTTFTLGDSGGGDSGGGGETTGYDYYYDCYDLTTGNYLNMETGTNSSSIRRPSLSGYTYVGYVYHKDWSSAVNQGEARDFDGTGTTCTGHSSRYPIVVFFYTSIQNYTITYKIGTATSWSDGTTGNKTQTKQSNSNISLYGAIGVKNSITSTANTFTFNGNGATTQSKSTETSNATTSYTHTSWNTSSGGGGTTYALDATYSTNSDITLYPRFTSSISYTSIHFPKANECQRTNYTLLGWSSSSSATSAEFSPGDALSGNHATKTWYAVWTPTKYTITYNLNNGVQDSEAITNYTVETSTFNLPIPTRTGYAFVGWYDNSSFSGNRITQIIQGSSGNKTYYAKWALIQTFYWINTDYSSNGLAQYLHDLTSSNGVAINWYVPTAQVKDFINKINTYCGTSLIFNEKQLLADYNALVNALNNSSAPDHLSGTTTPSLSIKSTDDYISSDDLIALENAFNNRKFI